MGNVVESMEGGYGDFKGLNIWVKLRISGINSRRFRITLMKFECNYWINQELEKRVAINMVT